MTDKMGEKGRFLVVFRACPPLVFILTLVCALSPIARSGAEPSREALSREETPAEIRPIDNPETLKILRNVQEQVENLRGIRRGCPLPASYLDSETLRRLVAKSIEEELPPSKMRALTAFLSSLGLITENLDLAAMYTSLFDEQVGGLYDTDSKRLFVRERFDLANSPMARLILAHEICHALQDHAFGLKNLGIDKDNTTDRILAAMAIAEGDAMLLMNEYAVRHAARDMLRELPGALMMDQSALEQTPHFFRQQLLFPYIQGQVFIEEAISRHPEWRDRIFEDPPVTTEQLIHPERFFDNRDHPSPLLLLAVEGQETPEGVPIPPTPPNGLWRHETDSLGEYGIRLVFEERLGAGIAHTAAAGWDGDALLIYADMPPASEEDESETPAAAPKAWWFCWETAWDSARDAQEFSRAWTTIWRLVADDRSLGAPADEVQEFTAGSWSV